MSATLLLTATINPGPTPVLTLRDPVVRFQHYVAALLLWARNSSFNHIVICENSGEGNALERPVKIIFGKEIETEILTFTGNSGSWEFGKGYGEGVILEHAFLMSGLLKKASSIWKSTGRLYVTNATRLVELHQNDGMVMRAGDTRFWKIDPSLFLEVLKPAHKTINDHRGTSIEVAYERSLVSHVESGKVVRFKETPDYIGQDAGSGNWHAQFPKDIMDEAIRIASDKS